MALPRMVHLSQQFERPRVEDIRRAVAGELTKLGLERTIQPGQSVALTAGSRGIANISLVLQAVVEFLKKLGARPFLVPAMGSHGGGTAEGQRKILESYGITETSVGAPIKASMEVVKVGVTAEGFPVLLDRQAREADHIGIVARIKPHTGYQGPIESGLLKMMLIGLGKHEGALAYHRILLERPFDLVIRSVTRALRANASIAFGLGLVENAYEDTAQVAGVLPADFEKREEELLIVARRLLARLPVREADVLIIDRIGKDISGSGMDTNIVGRKRAFGSVSDADQPRMKFIFVRGLSEKTHGNATGIGLADFTTTRLIKSMDYRATVINCLTAGYPDNANLPVYFDTDREVIDAALAILGTRPPEKARIVWIKDTMHLEEVQVSEASLESVEGHAQPQAGTGARDLSFDGQGNLAAW